MLRKLKADPKTQDILVLMVTMDGCEFVLEMRKRDASRSIPSVVITARTPPTRTGGA